MSQIIFQVQGSAPTPYEVTFMKSGDNLTATCTCPAGVAGIHCKHRVLLMAGDTSGVVSGNTADVSAVMEWLAGSDVAAALQLLDEEERALEEWKKRVSAAKRALAAAMNS